MPNEIIPFNSLPVTAGGDVVVPKHIADAFEGESNIDVRVSIDQLSYRGKVWRRVVGGEETVMTKLDADNERVNMQSVKVVVLAQNKARSRSFYAGAYTPGENKAPDCYSADGITPDKSVQEPCADKCAECPNAVKGSKITDNGKGTTACSVFKRLAIVPGGVAGISKHPVMLLRLAQTSVWDKDDGANVAEGWYAWDQFQEMLKARGANHSAQVETHVKFDSAVEYPKLLFSTKRWLSEDEVMAAKARIKSDQTVIGNILTGGDRDGVAGTGATKAIAAPKPAAEDDGFGQVANKPSAAAALAEAEANEEAAALAATAADKKAKAQARLVKAAKDAEKTAETARIAAAAAAAPIDDDDGGFGEVAAPAAKTVVAKTAPKAAAATPTASPAVIEGGDVPAGLASLMDNWGSDDPE
jgi:hypothetical protein